jgi:hypothetical protein
MTQSPHQQERQLLSKDELALVEKTHNHPGQYRHPPQKRPAGRSHLKAR